MHGADGEGRVVTRNESTGLYYLALPLAGAVPSEFQIHNISINL